MKDKNSGSARPVLELKNVKYRQCRSQETPCYEATLYVDGKRFAYVGNDGRGGPDFHYPPQGTADPAYSGSAFWQAFKELNDLVSATYPPFVPDTKGYSGAGVPRDVELVCHEIIEGTVIGNAVARSYATVSARSN